MSDATPTLDRAKDKTALLDSFAAPFFSGMVVVAGSIFISEQHYPTGTFMICAALGYWSRSIYLYWQEWKCLQP